MKYIRIYEDFSNNSKSQLRDHYMIGDLKVNLGDKVKQDISNRMTPLPESQVPVEDGLYTLKYIPISKTDIVIDNFDTREVFKEDDYDGYQTETFEYMLKHFDELPPIIFEEKEGGTYGHIDGHHRIIIAKELGRDKILAFIKEKDQSGDHVNNPPPPEMKSIKKRWMFNIFKDENKWAYFYKGKRIDKTQALKLLNTGDVKSTNLKYLNYYQSLNESITSISMGR